MIDTGLLTLVIQYDKHTVPHANAHAVTITSPDGETVQAVLADESAKMNALFDAIDTIYEEARDASQD